MLLDIEFVVPICGLKIKLFTVSLQSQLFASEGDYIKGLFNSSDGKHNPSTSPACRGF